MKVLDLQCGNRHVFEGWFASEDDFQEQSHRGLIECPVCENSAISKRLSAPRLNLTSSRAVDSAARDIAQSPDPDQGLQILVLKMAQHIVANTDDVGNQFAEEARKIHYGETKVRSIRGQASRKETEALQDEGIGVVSLLLPAALKGPLQ